MFDTHRRLYPLFLLFLLTAFFSCQPDEGPDLIDPPPVEVYEQYGTPLGDIPETEDLVMYEVNLRAFSSRGDLQGVINRLDNIQSLGVNVIWLMPIHPIGEVNSVNSPYSVKNYKEVGAEYGSLADLRALTDAAHQRGMAVILDWIANHTAWDNPWISNKNWYTQDANGNIIHPAGTNWMDVADLNFDNADMRLEMIDALKYWALEANVDGYRCDAADFVPFDFWKQAWDKLRSMEGREFILLAEGGRNDHFTAGFDLNFGWDFYTKIKQVYDGQVARGLFGTHQDEYNGLPAAKHKLRFTTNHDESAWDATPITLFDGKAGALAASVVTTFLGGVPLIYGGQEVGRATTLPFFSNSPIDWTANPDMLAAYQEMMGVYTREAAARKGSLISYQDNNICSFQKSWEGEELLVMVNMRNQGMGYAVPVDLQQSNWENALTGESLTLGTSLSFDGYAYLLLKK